MLSAEVDARLRKREIGGRVKLANGTSQGLVAVVGAAGRRGQSRWDFEMFRNSRSGA